MFIQSKTSKQIVISIFYTIGNNNEKLFQRTGYSIKGFNLRIMKCNFNTRQK